MTVSFEYGEPGPLLAELLDAQRREEAAVSHPRIEAVAEALLARAEALEALVWPVGSAAERVAGAATVMAHGGLAVAPWNSRLDDERVLLFAVAGATPLSLVAAAAQVRSMGAGEVHACAVDVAGAADAHVWESFTVLAIDRHAPALIR